jgi:hypothetical protein
VKENFSLFLIAAICLSFSGAFADDDSVQPYIDHLKQGMKDPTSPSGDENGSPYIDSLKAKLPADDSIGYSAKIKEQLDKGRPTPGVSGSPYIDQEKAKIGPGDQSSPIADVAAGHSELPYVKNTDVKNTFGIRYGVGLTRNITANSTVGTGRDFNGVYGSNYAPDFALYYEYLLFRKPFGQLGIFGMGEVGIFKGLGTFQVQPVDAVNPGQLLSDQSSVQFTYIELPAVAGLDFRIPLFKYVEPYVMAGPAVIYGLEERNDGGGSYHVLSGGYYGSVGISVLMDWISRKEDWARYDQGGIKHAYLNVEYSHLGTFTGGVNYSVSGPYLGVTFDF